MANLAVVELGRGGRRYYVDIEKDQSLVRGSNIIIEMDKCLEFATILNTTTDSKDAGEIYQLIRIATDADIKKHNTNLSKYDEYKNKVQKKVDQYNLDMKLVKVRTSFDGQKLLVIYTADDRVDFRVLVRDLATLFHTRVEMRQIGEREATAIIGGCGACGQEFCCRKISRRDGDVGIKMAKIQGLSLNPSKINGACGKLMCCLQYEYSDYKKIQDAMPKLGEKINTKDGEGMVVFHDLLNEKVAVKYVDDNQDKIIKYSLEELELNKK